MPLNDDSTFPKRLKRYAQVTTAAGSLATKMAGAKLRGRPLDQDQFAELLVSWLGNLKGPLVKVAQLIAMIPDLLPPAYVERLMTLQSEAPSMGTLFVKRRLRSELGDNWKSKFVSFDLKAVAAASLGQVHQATSLEGAALAVKLQYPDMPATIEADISQLKLLFSLYEKYDPAIDHKEMVVEIATHLLEELDYVHEAKNIEMFQKILQPFPEIQVPTVEPDLSTKRLLTMSWCPGEKILVYKEAPLELRNAIAKNLFTAWYYPLYKYGALHGDPHMGNYRVTDTGAISVFDFGCVRVFPPSFIAGIVDLYHALLEGRPALAEQAYEKWGFQKLTKPLIEALNLWARYLYGPILEDKVRAIDTSFSSKQGRAVASEVQRLLKEVGGVCPPREFVFVDRAAVGLGSVFMHLKAEQNWHQLFESFIADFSEESLATKQSNMY